jgi:hypothetical protein
MSKATLLSTLDQRTRQTSPRTYAFAGAFVQIYPRLLLNGKTSDSQHHDEKGDDANSMHLFLSVPSFARLAFRLRNQRTRPRLT